MLITKITKIKPKKVFAIQTSTKTFIADGLAHHNCMRCNIHGQGQQEIFIGRLEKDPIGLEFLKEAGYQDENGAWRCKKEEPINARDFLTNLLETLKNI